MCHTAAINTLLTRFGAVKAGAVLRSRLSRAGSRCFCAAQFPADIPWRRLHDAENWLARQGFAARIEFPNAHPVLCWTMPAAQPASA